MKPRLPVWDEIPLVASLACLPLLIFPGRWQGTLLMALISVYWIIQGVMTGAQTRKTEPLSGPEKDRLLGGMFFSLVAYLQIAGFQGTRLSNAIFLTVGGISLAIVVGVLGWVKFRIKDSDHSLRWFFLLLVIVPVFLIGIGRLSSESGSIFNRNASLYKNCWLGNKEEVAFLLELGASPNATGDEISALSVALESGNHDVAVLLLRSGTSRQGQPAGDASSPFHRAIRTDVNASGSTLRELFKLLVKAGWDINEIDSNCETALMYALRGGDTLAAGILIECGAKPDFVNKQGETALHLAVKRDDPAAVIHLLKANADRNIRDRNGKTALDYAEGRPVLLALLNS